MRTKWALRSIWLIIVAASLVCCGKATPEPTRAPSPPAQDTAAPPQTFSPSPVAPVEPSPSPVGYAPVFEEAPCPLQLPPDWIEGQNVDCGYLVVPEDREEPAGRTIRLAVAIFHPPGRVIEPDPIIYLSGGPGASILELLYLSFDRAFTPLLVTNRDIILFDQRGVGYSEPALDCPDAFELGLELLDYEMDGNQLTDEQADELLGEAYIVCEQGLSAIADLTTYNTVNSAADVNDLRIALGYDKINLLGGSYGTRLALGVMRDYPEGLRSVVLDSVYPPDVNMYLEAPANLDRALKKLFDACAADQACDAAFSNLDHVFFDTVQHLNDNPVDTVITNPLTGESFDARLDGNNFLSLVFQLLYETELLPELPRLICDAHQGRLDTVNRIRGALLAQSHISSRGMSLSVQCNEELAFCSLEQFEAILAGYPELAAYFKDSILGCVAFDLCEFWGSGQADAAENEAVSSDIPTLVMMGEYDPITPPAWGQHAAETLENAYAFVYPGVGHGAAVVEGCPREMLLAFLTDPAVAPDASCISQMEGLRFAVPAASSETIALEPFASPEKGLQGVAPAGWTEVRPGVYMRSSSALDQTSLIVDLAPLTADEMFGRLAQDLGFDPGLAPVAQEQLGSFTWDLYTFESQGLSFDLALTEGEGTALFVLLVSEPEEHDTLYEQVFRPAVGALVRLP